jgi:tetratricopeptide (TPR) repeat protein
MGAIVRLGMWVARIALRFVGRWRLGVSWARALMVVFVVMVFDSRLMRAEDAPEPIYSACHPHIAFAAFAKEVSKTSDPSASRLAANAGVAMASHNYDQAIERFDRAIALSPENPTFFIGRGRAKLEYGDLDHALEDFDQAARLNPHSFLAQIGRGQVYARKRDHEDAFAAFEASARLYPRNAAAYVDSGFIHLRRRDYDRAIPDLGEAIRIDPTCSINFMYRGIAYELMGEKALATLDYARMKQLPYTGVSNILIFRAFTFHRLGIYERAVEDLNEVLSLDPKDAIALNSRCFDLAILGKFDAALVDCDESLRIRSDAAHTLDSRGFTHLRMGALDNAIADYDAALRINPRSAPTLYGRGVARRLTGDVTGGDADVSSAQAISPDIADQMTEWGLK